MTLKAKSKLNLFKVFRDSLKDTLKHLKLIFILPLVFTPIGIAIEKAIELIPNHGIHYFVGLGLNFFYIGFLVLIHFAYLVSIIDDGSWGTAFHTMMLDDLKTVRKFFNYFLVNLKLMLIMLLPSVLIIQAYEDPAMHKGISIGMFLLACLLSSSISAKFAFGLVLQAYGQGEKKERALRLIASSSSPCYTELVVLEFLVTVIIYLPKWVMGFYAPDNQWLYYAYHNYLVLVLNFVASIWIVKAFNQVYLENRSTLKNTIQTK